MTCNHHSALFYLPALILLYSPPPSCILLTSSPSLCSHPPSCSHPPASVLPASPSFCFPQSTTSHLSTPLRQRPSLSRLPLPSLAPDIFPAVGFFRGVLIKRFLRVIKTGGNFSRGGCNWGQVLYEKKGEGGRGGGGKVVFVGQWLVRPT